MCFWYINKVLFMSGNLAYFTNECFFIENIFASQRRGSMLNQSRSEQRNTQAILSIVFVEVAEILSQHLLAPSDFSLACFRSYRFMVFACIAPTVVVQALTCFSAPASMSSLTLSMFYC